MRGLTKSERQVERPSMGRTMLVIALLGLFFGLLGMGEIGEDALRISRNKLSPANASGDIVLIEIDERAQHEVGAWPWKRSIQANLIDRLSRAGARHIALDMIYDFHTDPGQDKALADAFARSGKVVLPIQFRSGDGDGAKVYRHSIEAFASKTVSGVISVNYNYQLAVWRMTYAWHVNGRIYSSFASILSDTQGAPNESFPIDYRYRMDSIPHFSAADVLSGRANLAGLNGKSVIVGLTATTLGDQYLVPGRGRYGGVYPHIYAAETLKHGAPIDLGWLPALAAALLICAAAMRPPRMRFQGAIIGSGTVVLLAAPILTEPRHLFFDIFPGLFALVLTASILGWRRYRTRAFINVATGLPNLEALKALRDSQDRPLIVARVLNYSQLAAALNAADERTLVKQITARLGVGTKELTVFQGGEGIFAWLAEPGIPVGHHVEALHALFRSPARIASKSYDLSVVFGVEIGSGRTMANRLGSALVAADEAATEGLKWKYHDPERQKDAGWRLSLLAQLDEAIERGEVWVAFQPQLDLATGRIRGAEALARWTHPEKGPISPHEFISAAEQHGRIDRLTMFMLDQSIEAAAKINRDYGSFNIAVNLSARTLARRSLPSDVRALLLKHRLPPELLTLELTETAAMASDGSDLDPLFRLRDLGISLSIDDYGTGMSTLEYLKTVPASEIKIDQSFIKSIKDNRSDQLMVRSTIALAHSLGRRVVAEGVETEETLAALKTMNCDTVQGFLIGRPSSYSGLVRHLQTAAKGRAA